MIFKKKNLKKEKSKTALCSYDHLYIVLADNGHGYAGSVNCFSDKTSPGICQYVTCLGRNISFITHSCGYCE